MRKIKIMDFSFYKIKNMVEFIMDRKDVDFNRNDELIDLLRSHRLLYN